MDHSLLNVAYIEVTHDPRISRRLRSRDGVMQSLSLPIIAWGVTKVSLVSVRLSLPPGSGLSLEHKTCKITTLLWDSYYLVFWQWMMIDMTV